MASIPLSSVATGTALSGSDTVLVVQGGVVKQVPGSTVSGGGGAVLQLARGIKRVKAGLGNSYIRCVGTSFTRGYGASQTVYAASPTATTQWTGSAPYAWPHILVGLLNAAGIPAHDAVWSGSGGLNVKYNLYDTKVNFPTGWSDGSGGIGPGPGGPNVNNGSVTTPATFEFGITCDTVAITVGTLGSGSVGTALVEYSTDGTSWTTVSGGGTINSLGAGSGFVQYTFTMPKAVNKIRITPASAVNLIYLSRVAVYDSTASFVIVENMGVGGGKADGITDASFGLTNWLPAVAIVPDITFFDMGKNEEIGGTTIATTKTNFAAAVEQLARWSDVIVPITPARSSTTYSIPWDQYRGALRATPGLMKDGIDLPTVLGPFNTATYSDPVHPNRATYALIAQRVMDQYVTPAISASTTVSSP